MKVGYLYVFSSGGKGTIDNDVVVREAPRRRHMRNGKMLRLAEWSKTQATSCMMRIGRFEMW